MQIKKNQIDAIKQFGREHKVMMLFGPNQKLLDSYADDIKENLRKQDYEISFIDYDGLKNNLAPLWEIIAVPSLFHIKKLVVIDVEKATIKNELFELLAIENKQAAILIRAGDLPASHSLRKNFEASSDMVSIGCYEVDQLHLRTVAVQDLSIRQIKATPEVIRSLVQNYQNPGVLKKDLEILDLWLGDRRELQLEDLSVLTFDQSDYKYLDLAFSLVLNKKEEVIKILKALEFQGIAHISIIRAMMNFFYRLYTYQALLPEMSSDIALSKVSPPVFFKEKPDFLRSSSLLPTKEVLKIIEALNDLEQILKTSDIAAKECLENFFLQLNENKEIYEQLKDLLAD